MDMQATFVKHIVLGLFEVGIALAIVLLQRYLFGLSTIDEDIRWLHRRDWYSARWYRGIELIHQLRARAFRGKL